MSGQTATGTLRVRSALAACVLLAGVPALAAGGAVPRAPAIRRTAVVTAQGGERQLRSPLAIARDPKTGELVVSSFESEEVLVLGRSGAVTARIGIDAGLVTPYGVAVDAAGRIWVSEVRTGRLKVLGPGGALQDEIDLSQLAGRAVRPGRITISEDGRVIVADLATHEVLVVDARGTLVRTAGPVTYVQKAAAIDGRIFALSGQGSAITVLDAAGKPERSFGRHGETYERTVSFPSGFAVDAKGRIWIADAFQHRLKVFTSKGEFLFNVGGPEGSTTDAGFFFPVDLVFGPGGELVVLEKGAERIQTFKVADLAEPAR